MKQGEGAAAAMGDNSTIEWTEATWNPVHGCQPVSPGCANCYAEEMTARLEAMGQASYAGLTRPGFAGGRKLRVWTGDFREVPAVLDQPLRWTRARTIFVCSMSDIYGEGVSDEYIAAVWGIMLTAWWHTFQVLTKRADRLVQWFDWLTQSAADANAGRGMSPAARCLVEAQRRCQHPLLRQITPELLATPWPLPNVWVGTTVEDRRHGIPRIAALRSIPAWVRYLSMEPLLEDPGDISEHLHTGQAAAPLDWVIVGGESGRHGRPMHPDWVRGVRDQCQAAGVPFLFKQWGRYVPRDQTALPCPPGRWGSLSRSGVWRLGVLPRESDDEVVLYDVGKKAAGRLLDGRTWDEMPGRPR